MAVRDSEKNCNQVRGSFRASMNFCGQFPVNIEQKTISVNVQIGNSAEGLWLHGNREDPLGLRLWLRLHLPSIWTDTLVLLFDPCREVCT